MGGDCWHILRTWDIANGHAFFLGYITHDIRMSNPERTNSWLILSLRPANEGRRYFVTTSLIGWAQTSYQPANCAACHVLFSTDHRHEVMFACCGIYKFKLRVKLSANVMGLSLLAASIVNKDRLDNSWGGVRWMTEPMVLWSETCHIYNTVMRMDFNIMSVRICCITRMWKYHLISIDPMKKSRIDI